MALKSDVKDSTCYLPKMFFIIYVLPLLIGVAFSFGVFVVVIILCMLFMLLNR